MNIEKKIGNILGNIEDNSINPGVNGHVLLDISEPLMFTLNQFNTYYLAYVLQNKSMVLKGNQRADVSEVLLVSTTVSEIKELIEGRIDIIDALYGNKEMCRIGKINNKVFPGKKVTAIEEIENRIPKKGVKLDHHIPNRINVKNILKFIEAQEVNYRSFCISENTKISEEIIEIDYTDKKYPTKIKISSNNFDMSYSKKRFSNIILGENNGDKY